MSKKTVAAPKGFHWMKSGKVNGVFAEFYRVLKKGGILGVVEHRANKKSKTKPHPEPLKYHDISDQ